MANDQLQNLVEVYKDLHAHPELALSETRTASIMAKHLREYGFSVTENVGFTGVVGILERGTGPTVLLRADMDGLPVREETGLPYASTGFATGENGKDLPVMHACGHDIHMTSLLGALEELAGSDDWQGRLIAVFQPAEENGAGARAMVADGLFKRFGTPDVVLGQHVSPLPAGMIGLRSGTAFAASDALSITLFGRGGHGSRPETTVDPVVLAAAVVLRLQTIVSRELAGTEIAVITVGSIHAGEAPNIIPDRAELKLSIRTFDSGVRQRVFSSITRIVNGEANVAGAERMPLIEPLHSFPAVVNDDAGSERVREAFARELKGVQVIDPGVLTGSEDVGILATEAGAPCVYWILGGADPALFADVRSAEDLGVKVGEQPSNHSPFFAPVIRPTLDVGVKALTVAARAWLNVASARAK